MLRTLNTEDKVGRYPCDMLALSVLRARKAGILVVDDG